MKIECRYAAYNTGIWSKIEFSKAAVSLTHTRKFLVVLFVVAVPTIGISLLFGWVNGWKWTPDGKSAATWWIVTSCVHFLFCSALALWQLKRIRDDLDEYFNDFYHDKVRPPTESPSKPAAEGQSSLLVTVWGIYGLAAFIGSIILYFAFAQAWNPSDFIFSNNEGFVAALALLIIVLSGAIVPIYTDLAKQVRQQTDTFELEISSLCQTVAEIDIHATALWVHFERMAQETLMQWTESLGSEVIGRAAHDCLFKPFDIARNEQVDVSKKPDHYFQRWSETQVQTVPIPVLSDATKHLKGIEQLTKPTDTSVSKTRILRVFRITPKPEESLTYQERQTRTRRLRYIGWSAQGPLAIASYKTFLSTTEEGRVFHRTPFNEINPLIYRRYPPVDNEAEGVFLNGSKYLVPASENFIVEVLREQLRQQRETNGNFNLPDLEGNQLEFSKRCGRHLARWDSFEQSQEARSLRTSLSNACASLELDIAFFSDDMTLFNHLALNNREANPATNVGLFARFLYYSFWLIAPRQKTTIKEILEIFKVETSSKNDIEHRSTFSDLHGALLDFLNRDKHEDPIFTAVSRQTHAYGNLFPVLLERLFEKLAKKTNLVIGTLPEKRLREKFIESLSDDSNDADIKLFKAWLKHETFDNEIEITAEEFEVMGQKIFDEIKKNSKCNEFFSQETEWKIVGDEHNRKNTTEEFLYLSLADHQSALYNWMRAARSGEIRNDIIDFRERLKQHESRKQLGIDITPSRHDRLAHLQDFLKLPYQGGTLRVRSIYDLMPSTKEFHLKKQVTKNQTDQSYIPYLKMLKFSGLPKNKQKDCAMSDELQKNIYLSINDNKPIDPKHLGSSKFRETFLKWLLEALDVSSPALQKEPDVLTNVLRTMRLTHNKPELMDQYIERLYCKISNDPEMLKERFGFVQESTLSDLRLRRLFSSYDRVLEHLAFGFQSQLNDKSKREIFDNLETEIRINLPRNDVTFLKWLAPQLELDSNNLKKVIHYLCPQFEVDKDNSQARQKVLQKVLQKVTLYCLEDSSQSVLEKKFFGGDKPATAVWLEKFKERLQQQQEDETSEPDF